MCIHLTARCKKHCLINWLKSGFDSRRVTIFSLKIVIGLPFPAMSCARRKRIVRGHGIHGKNEIGTRQMRSSARHFAFVLLMFQRSFLSLFLFSPALLIVAWVCLLGDFVFIWIYDLCDFCRN